MRTLVLFTLLLSMQESFSQDIPLLKTRAFSYESEEFPDDISYMCSLGCAMGWDVTASSHLAPQSGNSYDAKKLDDGRPSTAWVEGKKGYGVGETVTFHFPAEYFVQASIKDSLNFNGFRILNGYTKDSTTWGANSRVKKLRLLHNQQPIADILLQDTMLMQEVDSDIFFYFKPNETISLVILDVYPGSKYQDTAISELIPMGAH